MLQFKSHKIALLSYLDLKNTVFGKVIDGWDSVDTLERLPVNPKNFKPASGKFIKSIELNYLEIYNS